MDFFFLVGDALFAMPDTDNSACIGDNSPSFPGVTYVSSMGAMKTSLLIDNDELMPLKCPKILDTLNNYFFYFNMHLPIHKKLCDAEKGGGNNSTRRFRNLRGLGMVAY